MVDVVRDVLRNVRRLPSRMYGMPFHRARMYSSQVGVSSLHTPILFHIPIQTFCPIIIFRRTSHRVLNGLRFNPVHIKDTAFPCLWWSLCLNFTELLYLIAHTVEHIVRQVASLTSIKNSVRFGLPNLLSEFHTELYSLVSSSEVIPVLNSF